MLRDYKENSDVRQFCRWHLIKELDEETLCKEIPDCCEKIDYFDWEHPGVLCDALFTILLGATYFSLILLREYSYGFNQLFIKKMCKKRRETRIDAPERYYPDVEAEKKLIDNMSRAKFRKRYVIVDDVSKTIGTEIVISHVTLAVKRYETLCILGAEGEDRTIFMKILTGQIKPTSGEIRVKDIRMKKNLKAVYKVIGYVPENAGLFEDFTVYENFRIYFLLRGIRKDFINYMMRDLAKALNISSIIYKQVKYISNSKQKRLNLGVALIGAPHVLYLDKISNQVDPIDRHRMWKVLTKWRLSGNSIIANVHNMESCEAVSTRLTIMINGFLHWLGPLEKLKEEFDGVVVLRIKYQRADYKIRRTYTLEQSIATEMSLIKEFIRNKFPDSILEDQYKTRLKFFIGKESLKWSEIFNIMEANKVRLGIEWYSVGQSSLVEILRSFKKSQRVSDI